MGSIHLTNRQWVFIRPLLPHPARTGRPRADDRRTIEGILYVLITGCRWQDLPHEYGAPTTVWRRLRRWGEEGVWERIWRAALARLDRQGQLDWTIGLIDGSSVLKNLKCQPKQIGFFWTEGLDILSPSDYTIHCGYIQNGLSL